MVVTKEKLNKYTNRVYGELVTDLEDNRKVFEALSEVIGEEYPESEDMEKVKTEFEKSSEENLNDFFEAKFDEYVDDSLLKGTINDVHRNKWVKYSVQHYFEKNKNR